MKTYDPATLESLLSEFMLQNLEENTALQRLVYTCEKFRIEPDHVIYDYTIPDYIMKEKLNENSELIEVASGVIESLEPILSMTSDHYLLAVNDCFGVVLDFISKGTHNIATGNQCSELRDSSYAVACALRQGLIAEVTGYEHTLPDMPEASSWHSVSAAICDQEKTVIGVLTLMNFKGPLPPAPQIIAVGTSIIESKLLKRLESKPLAPKANSVNRKRNKDAFSELMGKSEIMQNQKKYARRAAKSTCTILIEGESGTGKELMARAIHNESRPQGPFIVVNCGAIPMELLQSEFFGYEGGAFTGSRKEGMPGRFELANKGTLFLDEIGEMPLSMQVSLLRFLEDKIVVRIGGQRSIKTDVRIVAATNRDLQKEVILGNFREDLYYRLNVFQIKMPPLRQHREDIPQIAEHTLLSLCLNYGRDAMALSESAIKALQNYDWPGNVRELKNVLEKAIIYSDLDVITEASLPGQIKDKNSPSGLNPPLSLKELELNAILETLNRNDWNVSKSARELSITRATLHKKIKGHSLYSMK